MLNEKIIAFLINRGWIQTGHSAKFIELRAPQQFNIDEAFRINVPVELNKSDIKTYTDNLLSIIADFYSLSIDDLNLILEKENTILKVRIYDEKTKEGKISFNRFEELIDKLKLILTDTASFVIDKSVTSLRVPDEAYRYLNLCNFLQTEKGSFVTKIQLPSKELIKDKELFNQQEIYSEDINQKLSEVLSFVNESVFNVAAPNVTDEYLLEHEQKINIKLLKDIETFYDKAELKNIDFSFHNIKESTIIETQEVTKEKLFKLTTFVDHIANKSFETINLTLRGKITTLKSRDPDGLRNNITVGGIFDDLPVIGVANLTSENYKLAIEAHKLKQYIKISGLARKTKSRIRFIEVTNFAVEV
jgi:hypothetical protein